MKKSSNKEVLVYASWQGLKKPQLMGTLYTSRLRGKELFQFEYTSEWIRSKWAVQIDPELGLYSGRQFPSEERKNFGVFLDSMPDRWGRQLMQRREAIEAREEGRPAIPLFESDYLLGVFDIQRQGGLRFRLPSGDYFLNDDRNLPVPPISSMRELEFASLEIERDINNEESTTRQWINMLLAPGSSLGGARPKAGVLDEKGQLWIAKFPSHNDDFDKGAWELVVNQLGKRAGLSMATCKTVKLNSAHHTLLSRRFDRTASAERIHFASAMTMLQKKDGDDFSTGTSYLEMVDFILRNGANPYHDLKELWHRVVFSILVSNTDDHLRNHGFLLDEAGWVLSPAYDVNPDPAGTGLRLNISEFDNSLDTDLALSVAKYFRLDHTEAKQMLYHTKSAISAWRRIATDAGIPLQEKDRMEKAFR